MTEAAAHEEPSNEGTTLQWQVRLWEKNPSKRWGIVVAASLAGLVGYLMFKTPLMALVGFGAIFAATTDFWLPQQFKLDGNGAHMRCGISVTSVEWNAVKRATPTEEGLHLSPLEKPGRMDNFRGVFLRYANNKDEVLAAVSRLWGRDV